MNPLRVESQFNEYDIIEKLNTHVEVQLIPTTQITNQKSRKDMQNRKLNMLNNSKCKKKMQI